MPHPGAFALCYRDGSSTSGAARRNGQRAGPGILAGGERCHSHSCGSHAAVPDRPGPHAAELLHHGVVQPDADRDL